ncbi:hypothetical protein BT96DRAFT_840767 [Gymnopus androsaceus JB14]|uniref:Uncharacterized protein n=1 Tax=Gymnopus androsaceus JB14 TaxID=1447944 RepID=A0A6A4GII8_9AGAR|nr:hypothetical protein BT96DRAFT_840767 [Gymnopus androsaceus JB14]
MLHAFIPSLISHFSDRVSALLYQATENSTYLDAAIQSSDFIISHLYNATDGLVHDGISAENNSCSPDAFAQSPIDNGLLMAGLGILASVTQNPTTQQM